MTEQTTRGTVDLPSSRVGAPGRVGQSTAVEQSRAVAEVQAAVVLAHQVPRDENAAVARMREVCARPVVADRAFYRMPRAGGTVSGSTVHLMRELARVWGNVQYGISELDRDMTAGGRSEMLARAWDLESNTLVTAAFIVPHARDKGSGSKAEIITLATLGAVYENNANNGARRLRECIKAVLPSWFVEEAERICRQTIEKGDGTPLHKRVEWIIGKFAEQGVREDQLTRKIGKPAARWSAYDVADLTVIGSSIQRGEVRAEEEFPAEPRRVTGADIEAQAAGGGTAVTAAAPEGVPTSAEESTPDQPPAARMIRQGQRGRLFAHLKGLGYTDDDRPERLDLIAGILDKPVTSTNNLTEDEARLVLDTFDAFPDDPEEAKLAAADFIRSWRDTHPTEGTTPDV